MIKKITLLLALGFLSSSVSAGIFPFCKKKKKEVAVVDSTKTKKQSDYEKLMKDCDFTSTGLITLHKIKGKLYFEFPLHLMEREMLIGSTISEISNNANAVIGSKPQNPLHVKFSKSGNQVQLSKINSNYITTDKNSNLAKAIDLSTIGATLKNMKIDAYNKDSTAVVFEITDFFVGDNKFMSPFDPISLYTMTGYRRTESYQSDKSFLGKIKAFEDNIIIKSHLSYNYTLTTPDGKEAAKDVPFTAILTRSIVLLKEEPYRPRYGDYRMAVFPTGKNLLDEEDQALRSVYFSNRWDLEPSDKEAYSKGQAVTPLKPIVFYVDDAFPEKWKKYIQEGIEQWNEVFEEIGFKDAVKAEEFPKNDSVFDPDNVKYSCIRYAPIGIANAMGPSWVDPRSGEIITASVYVYHNLIELLNHWIFIQTAQTVEEVRNKTIPDEIVGDGLRYVISHEIGHCLGLMHNMSSSYVFPVDSLRSPTFTSKYGTTSSIMDYARYNYVAQPGDYQKGVKMTPPRFGDYDRYSIKWLYTFFPNTTLEEESDILSQWITERSGDPLYRYGKQQIYATLDPRSQVEDLGNDAMKASTYGINNLKYIIAHLDAWIVDDDEDFSYRKKLYNGIINQYLRYIGHVYANVGGIYLQEMKEGDQGELYESVPKDKQKEALTFIMNQVGKNQWCYPPSLSGKIGIAKSVSDLVDNALIKVIVTAPIKVIASSALADKSPYTFKECADDVYRFVWKSSLNGQALKPIDRMMQTEFVNAFLINANFVTSEQAKGHALQETFYKNILSPSNHFCSISCHSCQHAEANDRHAIHPVAGYEWSPEFRMFGPSKHFSDSFLYIQRVKSLLKGLIPSSSGSTKAHYEFLLNKIENSLTIK